MTECPYCGKEGKYIDKESGECTNKDCGGYFNLEPKWSLNTDWVWEE